MQLWETPFICDYCGYDRHVDVCHIKPIHEFDNSYSRVIEVNNPLNLICLCPNHHWELDHGYLDINIIR